MATNFHSNHRQHRPRLLCLPLCQQSFGKSQDHCSNSFNFQGKRFFYFHICLPSQLSSTQQQNRPDTPYRKKLKTCISKWTAQIFNQISAFNFRINEEHFKPDTRYHFFISETLIFGKKKNKKQTSLEFLKISFLTVKPTDLQKKKHFEKK